MSFPDLPQPARGEVLSVCTCYEDGRAVWAASSTRSVPAGKATGSSSGAGGCGCVWLRTAGGTSCMGKRPGAAATAPVGFFASISHRRWAVGSATRRSISPVRGDAERDRGLLQEAEAVRQARGESGLAHVVLQTLVELLAVAGHRLALFAFQVSCPRWPMRECRRPGGRLRVAWSPVGGVHVNLFGRVRTDMLTSRWTRSREPGGRLSVIGGAGWPVGGSSG